MNAVVVGSANLRECPTCEGIWADADTLQQICADREKQAAVLGMAVPVPPAGSVELEVKIRYVPCPVCNKLMNRVNFANCSHVVVDVCIRHGTWFDKDELRRIVEFIRAGGLEAARQREIAELEQKRSELTSAESAGALGFSGGSEDARYGSAGLGISAAAEFLKSLFK